LCSWFGLRAGWPCTPTTGLVLVPEDVHYVANQLP
jgi:hypothetical protein